MFEPRGHDLMSGCVCIRRTESASERLQNVGGIGEGILRSHMTMWNNRRRTSIYYSFLKDEWPVLKQTIFADIITA